MKARDQDPDPPTRALVKDRGLPWGGGYIKALAPAQDSAWDPLPESIIAHNIDMDQEILLPQK